MRAAARRRFPPPPPNSVVVLVQVHVESLAHYTTTATLTPGVSDSYYLVVPRNVSMEGSYGTTGVGAQRPPALTACSTQVLDPLCP